MANTSKVTVQPFNAPLGAFIDCGDLRDMTPDKFEVIRRAWLDHLVLVFSGQQLSDGELLEFCRNFGTLGLPPPSDKMQQKQAPRDPRYPEIAVVSNVIENGIPIGTLGAGEAAWHTDMSYEVIPHDGTMLYSIEIPPAGGDTWFVNMYLAYDTMPLELRNRLRGLKIKHDLVYKPDGLKRKGMASVEVTDISKTPGTPHPIIRTHPETRYNALFTGHRRNAYILGLPLDESEALVKAIWAHLSQPHFMWHHQWKVGDLVIWDNRCTMHRRDPFDESARRVMHQARTTGTAPFESEENVVAGPHPRGYLEHIRSNAA